MLWQTTLITNNQLQLRPHTHDQFWSPPLMPNFDSQFRRSPPTTNFSNSYRQRALLSHFDNNHCRSHASTSNDLQQRWFLATNFGENLWCQNFTNYLQRPIRWLPPTTTSENKHNRQLPLSHFNNNHRQWLASVTTFGRELWRKIPLVNTTSKQSISVTTSDAKLLWLPLVANFNDHI